MAKERKTADQLSDMIVSAMGIGAVSRADCALWASETSLPHQLALRQNGVAERLIGLIRRECLLHVIVRGEAHLRRILRSYVGGLHYHYIQI